ncbi:Stf0 family sulfotransferase [Thalassomonas actiniarum]|uniref:Sulphotransferase Stf0 domain-containing protein n=1 Tax=Thalassomonas actiniarum TaxID=485447 RepID=A0AAE9YRC0_9GAMM|nr:Stf0 family sulfotransferase [Thalassomonas actiniarum]WDD99267.1 hypothetical protein SG35_000830 [Thalassomonas actiniarum]
MSDKKQSTDERLLSLMEQLSLRDDNISDPAKLKKVLILSTPRSGSSMFCDVISRSQQVGECREWLNMRYVGAYAKMKKISNINIQEYLNFIMNKTILQTDVFAVNMHIEQYISLIQNKFDPMTLGFDVVVYLSRKNKLEQAISLLKAQLTDKWTAETQELSKLDEKKITPAAITQALSHIIQSEAVYQEKLQHRVSLELFYEDFKHLDTTESFEAFFKLINKPFERSQMSTAFSKQKDSVTDKYFHNYMNYLTGKY